MAISVPAYQKPQPTKRHVELEKVSRGLVPPKASGMSDQGRPPHLHVNTHASNTNGLAHLSSSLPLPQITPDEQNSPRTNKARNKLGYHRSSVACGHCRRRKIRCKVDSKNSHGRCESCIKLKRECEFQPIDLPSESATSKSSGIPTTKSKARAIASSKARSTSSSPAVQHELPTKSEPTHAQYSASYSMPPCQSMGPPVLRHHGSSAILADCHDNSEDTNGLGHPIGQGPWASEAPQSPGHGARSGFQSEPWKQQQQFPCESPSIGYGHFPMQVTQQPTDWPTPHDDLATGTGGIRAGGDWDPAMHSHSPRTLSYGSEDSSAPQYVVLAGPEAHHRSPFDRRSSMGSDIYGSAAHHSAMASPVESAHPQGSMTQSMRQHGAPAPAYPWQQQQAYPYHQQRPMEGYGSSWYLNHQGPYPPQQHSEVRRQGSHGQLASQNLGHGH
ncbi:hypothetical protein Micbo1qcDRAFT_36657 [Microdochium bolleyi]|uniref:Zn(2)-C6 fungal-type domain-containing protein n=1 Tax=Microdochium bolleyi TaxID=196109 RepID=A0A136IMF5_9PEZI|nr:hypothetical protein Micbo1qcDRAFT_36657 [Microdochium bolleyi]